MNILYLSPARGPDYQCDMLCVGLRTLFGPSVVDYPRIPYLYADYKGVSKLYGKGFTLYGLLGDDSQVDRDDIRFKISMKMFDLVIFGSIHRYQEYLDVVTTLYPREKVIFVDGEDQAIGIFDITKYGIYFKRELASPHPGVFPIHFAIPSCKVSTLPPLKNKVRANIDPRDTSTYTYEDEKSYYSDYASSLFGITMKKGGWDCLRHLEIMANGCIPLFLDLDHCPKTTCTHLPKAELLEALTLMDKPSFYWDSEEGHSVWLSLQRRIKTHFVRHCTTEALAKYVIETQQRESA